MGILSIILNALLVIIGLLIAFFVLLEIYDPWDQNPYEPGDIFYDAYNRFPKNSPNPFPKGHILHDVYNTEGLTIGEITANMMAVVQDPNAFIWDPNDRRNYIGNGLQYERVDGNPYPEDDLLYTVYNRYRPDERNPFPAGHVFHSLYNKETCLTMGEKTCLIMSVIFDGRLAMCLWEPANPLGFSLRMDADATEVFTELDLFLDRYDKVKKDCLIKSSEGGSLDVFTYMPHPGRLEGRSESNAAMLRNGTVESASSR
ncbi:hypothetical protein BJ508DRAFT_358653 [Ascobolus immersus RN42]|uniref:Uncharacterized protein n=1 Tax=Ascobolus immersus RN42 TaxID=1160509 RepID=A0A3N4ILV9_ASCIM|nr:hypothetical protein BJ508DRAFT_358653 [Ascobolus immersus RN42]